MFFICIQILKEIYVSRELIRRRALWRLICFCTVCPFSQKRTPDVYGLKSLNYLKHWYMYHSSKYTNTLSSEISFHVDIHVQCNIAEASSEYQARTTISIPPLKRFDSFMLKKWAKFLAWMSSLDMDSSY